MSNSEEKDSPVDFHRRQLLLAGGALTATGCCRAVAAAVMAIMELTLRRTPPIRQALQLRRLPRRHRPQFQRPL